MLAKVPDQSITGGQTQPFCRGLDNRDRTCGGPLPIVVIDSEQEQSAILALQRGEMRGLEALVRAYQLQAVRVAFGVVGDRGVAEDAVADAFVLLYERIGQYDTTRPFAPWFYRIVVNCALKSVRGKAGAGKWQVVDVDDWADQQVSEWPEPEEVVEQKELRELVIGVVDTLPAEQRAVVVLRFYLDMDEAGIAEVLGCPLGTVKWRLHVAKRKLKEQLGEVRRDV